MATPLRPVIMEIIPENCLVMVNAVQANFISEPVTTKHYEEVRIHVYSVPVPDETDAGDDLIVANVYLQQSNDGNGWKTVATIANPTEEGEMYVLDAAPLTRVKITDYEDVDGTCLGIYAVLEKA